MVLFGGGGVWGYQENPNSQLEIHMVQSRACTTRCRRRPIALAIPCLPWKKQTTCDTGTSPNLIYNSKYIRQDCTRKDSDRNTYWFSLFLRQPFFFFIYFWPGTSYKAWLLTDQALSSRVSKGMLRPQGSTGSFGYPSRCRGRAHRHSEL